MVTEYSAVSWMGSQNRKKTSNKHKGNPNELCTLQRITYQYCFINFNKCIAVIQGVDKGENGGQGAVT